MLKKTAIKKIADMIKVDAGKLEQAINAKTDEDIEIPDDIQMFTKAELQSRDRNTYDTAKKAGEEMLVKNLKKSHALEFSGDDPEKLVEAIQNKVKAEVDKNPDARVAELQQVIETSKKTIKNLTEKNDQLKVEKETFQADTELLSMLPQDRMESMTNSEYLTLVKSSLKIENRDGKKVVVRDGQVQVDAKSLEPIKPEDAVKNYFVERKWIKEQNGNGGPSGRGGGNSNPGGNAGKFTKISQVHKHLEDNNISPNGAEGQNILMAAVKDNPALDMNS